jgi:nucleotide-binding universal stress UspA family protein
MQFTNVLYPINLDSTSIEFVNKVIEIAIFFECRLHILYVNDEGAGYRYPADHEDAVALKVKEVVPVELLDKLKIKYAVSKGKLAEQVFKYCTDNKIDLIITGHKHKNKLYSSMFDSPDVSIIDRINIPVLVVPKK